jgi:hypothetical protein
VFVISIVALSIILAWTYPKLAKFVWLLFLVAGPIAERVSPRLEHAQWIPWSKPEEPSQVGKK